MNLEKKFSICKMKFLNWYISQAHGITWDDRIIRKIDIEIEEQKRTGRERERENAVKTISVVGK